MDPKQTAYAEQAFGEQAESLVMVKYESQQHALDFIWSVLGDGAAIGLINGPQGSGKSTVMRQFVSELPRDTAVAVIDGTRIKPRGLLSEVLARYGYAPDLQSTDELLQMITMFSTQQARTYQAPILMIDNADKMFPSAMRTLNELASLTEQDQPALRIILTSQRPLDGIIGPGSANAISNRSIETLSLEPMTRNEALVYLHARLEACGVGTPDSVFPGDLCDRLHAQSRGWPGHLNALALAVMSGSESPSGSSSVAAGHTGIRKHKLPQIIVSRDGQTIDEFAFNDKKVLIGRSEFADIVIEDEFCSKFHVLLLLYSDGLVLLDLNSVNGTTVNSVRVKSTLLLEDDVISLGHHRLKIVNAPVPDASVASRATIADTTRMKSLDDLRRKRAAQLRAVPSGSGTKA